MTPFWSGATGGENRFLKVCGCGLTQNFSSGFNHPVVVASCHGRCKKFDSWGRHEHVSLPKNNIAPEKWIVGRLSFWGGKRSIFRGYNGYRLYTCFWGGYVMAYIHVSKLGFISGWNCS